MSASPPLPAKTQSGGAIIVPQHIWVIAVTILVVVMLHYFFKRTLMGKAMRATAVNRKAASLVGISVNRMILLSFAFSGALGAVAGMIIAPISTTSYDTGIMLGLKGFAAAILGGIRIIRCRFDFFAI